MITRRKILKLLSSIPLLSAILVKAKEDQGYIVDEIVEYKYIDNEAFARLLGRSQEVRPKI